MKSLDPRQRLSVVRLSNTGPAGVDASGCLCPVWSAIFEWVGVFVAEKAVSASRG